MFYFKNFYYIVYNKQKKLITGSLRAFSPQLAKAQLQATSKSVLYLQPLQVKYFPTWVNYNKQKKALSFFKQLLHLLNRGLNINEAFIILTKTIQDKPLQVTIYKIQQALQEGQSFGKALTQFPQWFNQSTIELFSITEATCSMTKVLTYFIEYQQQRMHVFAQIKKASTYPLFLLALGIVISLGLISMVMPELIALYNEIKAPLPSITQALLKISHISWTAYGIGLFIFYFITDSPQAND